MLDFLNRISQLNLIKKLEDKAVKRRAAAYSAKYMLVGALDCVIDFIFYWFLTRTFPFWRQHYLWANFLSFMASDCSVFDIARKWIFKLPVLPENAEEARKNGLTKEDEIVIHIHFFKYVFISFLAFLFNQSGLFIFVSLIKINDLVAKISMGVIVGIGRFLTHKFWTFRIKKNNSK